MLLVQILELSSIPRICVLYFDVGLDSYLLSVSFSDCIELIFCSYISYLPLAHIYERVNQVGLVYCGVAVGFYQGVRELPLFRARLIRH